MLLESCTCRAYLHTPGHRPKCAVTQQPYKGFNQSWQCAWRPATGRGPGKYNQTQCSCVDVERDLSAMGEMTMQHPLLHWSFPRCCTQCFGQACGHMLHTARRTPLAFAARRTSHAAGARSTHAARRTPLVLAARRTAHGAGARSTHAAPRTPRGARSTAHATAFQRHKAKARLCYSSTNHYGQ
eukprot:365070-Chlamydomonas_euryale.AAC.4